QPQLDLTIEPGTPVSIFASPMAFNPLVTIQLGSYRTPSALRLNSEVRTIDLHDERGKKLQIHLALTDPGGFTLQFFVPFWILNYSGADLFVRNEADSATDFSGFDIVGNKSCLLVSNDSPRYFLRLRDSKWSKPISLDT